MNNQTRFFYRFTIVHSFLIGLFPFYLPVFLWKQSYSFSDISFFISWTGVGYLVALWFWNKQEIGNHPQRMIVGSFMLEIILLIGLFFSEIRPLLPLIGLLNGFYNCFFWISNRILFLETINQSDVGRKYGNFQIIVAIVLKMGILSGGLLLDDHGLTSIFIFSLFIVVTGLMFLFSSSMTGGQPLVSLNVSKFSLRQLLQFKDNFRSKLVFSIDGLFLFLESYFWILTLFLITHESFLKLGAVVIILMIIFGFLFYFIKNSIDKMPVGLMYRISVGLYILSWIFRGLITDKLGLPALLLLLVFISFFTSLFRLSFNKQFFEIARSTSRSQYIMIKSYYSQFFLAIQFFIIGLLFYFTSSIQFSLNYLYLTSSIIALVYFFYRPFIPASISN